MPTIGKVPRDPRPQITGLMAAAINMGRGRPAGYGVIPVASGRYIMEDSRRPASPDWDSGPAVSAPEPESSKPRTMAKALWPDLK
jgi:hypothetical protein